MRKTILALTLLSASFAVAGPDPETLKTALEAQPDCGTFVRFDDDNLYLGFGSYRRGVEEPRQPIPGRFRVVPLNGGEALDLATNDAAIDLVTDAGRAFVLTFSSIEEWDLATHRRIAEYKTRAVAGEMAYKQHARAMARFKNKLVIAHGRLGVSIFDLGKKRLTNQFPLVRRQAPLESMATGVTVQGRYAYVAMDNFTLVPPPQKPALRGIVVIDMETESVVAELDGMDPGSGALISDARSLIVSFDGMPIWKYDLASLSPRATKMPEPRKRIWTFPMKGHPTGSPAMNEKYYYTCFLKAPEPGGNGWYTRHPAALDRRVLMLD